MTRKGDALGRATLLLSSSSLLGRGVGFVAALAGAAILAPGEYGLFGFGAATASVIGALGVLGLGPLVTRAIANANSMEEARRVAGGAMGIATASLSICLLAFVVLNALGISLGIPEDSRSPAMVTALLPWSLCTGLQPLMSAVAAGYKDFSLVTLMTVWRAALVGVSTVVGGLISGEAVGASVGAATGELLAAVLFLTRLQTCGRLGQGLRQNWRTVNGPLLKQSTAAGVASIAIQISIWVSQLRLLQIANGEAENGGLLLATRLTLLVTLIPSALATAYLPHLSDRHISESDLRAGIAALLWRGAAASLVAAACLSLISGVLLSTLGNGYEEFESTVLIMAVCGVMTAGNNILSAVAVARHQVRLWVFSDLVLATVLVAMAYPLAGSLGANGLAIAYLGAYFASTLVLVPTVVVRGVSRRGREVHHS